MAKILIQFEFDELSLDCLGAVKDHLSQDGTEITYDDAIAMALKTALLTMKPEDCECIWCVEMAFDEELKDDRT